MPTIPTMIPLIVAGIVLGSLLVSEKRKITRKKLLGVSLLGGLLNAANALIIYMLFPPPTTFSRFAGGNFGGGAFAGGTFTGSSTFQFRGAAGATSETSFIALSFITGLLVVIVIIGSALAYVRYKTPKGEEEPEESDKEEQEDLEESESES